MWYSQQLAARRHLRNGLHGCVSRAGSPKSRSRATPSGRRLCAPHNSSDLGDTVRGERRLRREHCVGEIQKCSREKLNTGTCRTKATVVTDEGPGTAGMRLVERPEPRVDDIAAGLTGELPHHCPDCAGRAVREDALPRPKWLWSGQGARRRPTDGARLRCARVRRPRERCPGRPRRRRSGVRRHRRRHPDAARKPDPG